MAWPLASDFSTVLQNPAFAFADPELKKVEIEKDANRQPRARSGAFANVYKAIYPNGKAPVAVRVFTSASPERRDRYQAIADHLANRRLECLVNFTYRDDGIRSMDGKRYPLVTMDWVRGDQLFDWVQVKCAKGDKKSLALASDAWVATINELRTAQIAHGDLQHANIMVTDAGKLKLVDYDCMCVPALVGRKNLEIGVDPYQLLARNQDTQLTLNLDNFSALFIFVALKAVAASPDLWANYVAKPQYDKLLFRREDLDSPKQSRLIQELQRSRDKEVQRLTKELVDLTHVRIDQVPRLDELLFSFGSVESLLSQRDFDGALELLTRNKKQVTDAPLPLQPRIRDAQDRVKHRVDLEKAVDAGDEPAMQRLYVPRLLDDYPRAQSSVAIAKLAPQVIPVLQRLQTASQVQKWRDFVREWNAHQTILSKRKSAERFASLAQTWKARNDAWDRVLDLLGKPVGQDGTLATAWGRLIQLGGHPESDEHRSRIGSMLERERSWSEFKKVPRAAKMAADVQLVKAWNEDAFRGWDLAERERPLVEQSRQRLAIMQQLRQLVSQKLEYQIEKQIIDLGEKLPPDYHDRLDNRIQQARQRVAAIRHLRLALKEPASDLIIVEICQRLDQLQGRVLLTSVQSERVALAEQRAPTLAQLKQIPYDYTTSQAPKWDAKLLSHWEKELLRDCQDAQPWLPAYEQAIRRKQLLGELQAAIVSSNKMRIAAAASDPDLKGYPLRPDWSRIVQQAQAEVKNLHELLDALKQDDPSRLWPIFNAAVLRQNSKIFSPHEAKLMEWMRLAILPTEKIGLSPPLARKGLVADASARHAYRICWNWPDPRFCDQCLVAICRNRPRPNEDPREITVHVRLPIDRKSFEEGGGSRLVHVDEEWLDSYVVVWAVVNLGFRSVCSEPLILGRIEASSKSTRQKPGKLLG